MGTSSSRTVAQRSHGATVTDLVTHRNLFAMTDKHFVPLVLGHSQTGADEQQPADTRLPGTWEPVVTSLSSIITALN